MSESAGMLAGLTVVDLTRFVSGAFASMTLATLGAEVLKIETPEAGDPYRNQGTAHIGEESVLFMTVNSGKKSVAIDFRAPESHAAMDALLSRADVFLENSRPGSLDRYELDFDDEHTRHPHIVYGSISGFGDVGPDSKRGGFDLILQAAGGLMSVTGHKETGPAKIGAPVTDVGAGLACVVGVLAAIEERKRTGVGRHIATSLLEFSLASVATLATAYLTTGHEPGLLGTHSPTFAPYGAFRARDGWFVVSGAGSEEMWRRFCDALGAPHLYIKPAYSDNVARVLSRDQLTADIEQVTATRDVHEWLSILDTAGVPAGRIRDLGDVLSSDQVAALGVVQELDHATVGKYPVLGSPIRVDDKPLPFPGPSPVLGSHTRDALLGAGLSTDEVDALIHAGVATEPA
jgi:crotonobetainyl-CoA:carnitine CoA-transferase CaiB-like acyl-CoA transferase